MLEKEKFNRLIHRYPEVFRGKSFNYKIFKDVYDKVTPQKMALYYYDQDLLHYIVFSNVIKSGRYLDIKLMSVYDLIDIYLGNIEDYPCLSAITNDVIAVYDVAGMPNKQRGNIVNQVIEQQRMSGRSFWMFFKGSLNKFHNLYPEVEDLIKDNNFSIVNVTSKKTSSEEEGIF